MNMKIGDCINPVSMEPADSLHFGVTVDHENVIIVLDKDGEQWFVSLSVGEFRNGVRTVFSSIGN